MKVNGNRLMVQLVLGEMCMSANTNHKLNLAIAAVTANCLYAAPVASQEDPKDVVAVQVRSQGYECNAPESASLDVTASRPDEKVWVLVCENVAYRVRLIAGMAAHIEKLD
jgi:hypothetical protein